MGNDKTKHHPPKTTCPCDPLINAIRHEDKDAKIPKKHFWRDWEPIEKFTFFIAIFTFIYSVVSICAYFISRENMVISQRAVIISGDITIRGALGYKLGQVPEADIEINASFMNTGATFARRVDIKMNSCIRTSDLPEEFSFPYSGLPDNQVSHALIGPKSTARTHINLSKNDLIAIQREEKYLFVYGEVTYFDVWGFRHKIQMCEQYNGYDFNNAGKITKYNFVTCEHHNCDDNDCPEKWGNPNITCDYESPKNP
jgi:hypothetical protein